MDTAVFDPSKPDAIELIARIEGSGNFYSLMAGIEAGPDTTGVMGALAFSRLKGAIPEVLEAHVAQSLMFRLPLQTMAFGAICEHLKPKWNDYGWIRGAVADAFQIVRRGECLPLHIRAKRFHVGHEVYGAMRKAAHGIFSTILNDAIAEFKRARRSGSETPGICQAENERGQKTPMELARMGSYRASPARLSDGSDDPYGHCEAPDDSAGRAIGFADDRGWNKAEAARVSTVLTLHGQEAAQHCERFPSQSSRHSLHGQRP
jgi:hypothetical protein